MPDTNRSKAEALFFQGISHMQKGESADAEACFMKAIELEPGFPEAHTNLAMLLGLRNQDKAAELHYLLSIASNPYLPQTHLNFGALLARQKRFIEAEAAYRKAIKLDANSPAAWSNLGVLYACMKREEEAERCYRTALMLDEHFAKARFNLSYIQLRQGRFEEGWQSLEARDWYAPLQRLLQMPRWQGEPLAGKSLLICFEAGLGDVIQFCRYAEVLKEQGAGNIALLCHPPLKSLLATLPGVDSILSFDEPLPSSGWDFWTPLLSIPHFCNTRLDSIPARIPYLRADSDRIKKWQPLLPKSGFKVGLVWRGSVHFENDADRSLPSLALLSPLWAVKNIAFVSLQKGAGENEMPPDGLPLIRIGTKLSDLADTAAVVACLDLVISVDTAVAHLAGAMGKPCWVLLPDYKTDWRWLKERADSPWYPDVMRLFRQPETGKWAPVISELTSALKKLTQQS